MAHLDLRAKMAQNWPNLAKNQKSAPNKFFALVLPLLGQKIRFLGLETKKKIDLECFLMGVFAAFYPYFVRKCHLGPIFKTSYLENGKRYLSSVKRFWSPISSR